MKSVKGHQGEEEEEEDDYDFGSNKDVLPSTSNTKDGKSNDKAYAIRSKHSVTEQRRRSKINERFQMLRNLIPNTDQKRDTASFLLEVFQYVQHLEEKVDKYEGSHQPWSSETAKLMPWVNSPAATFTGRFDKNLETGQNDNAFSESLHRRASDECPSSNINALNHQEEFMIEGGTISISSAYSQGLLNSLTQALQATGLDLSEATISVHVNLGRPANRESENPPPAGNQFREANNDEASDHAQKRLKI